MVSDSGKMQAFMTGGIFFKFFFYFGRTVFPTTCVYVTGKVNTW